MKKLLIFLSITGVLIAGCGGDKGSSGSAEEKPMQPGELVYIQHCKLCHGTKGDLGLSGAANLKISVLNSTETHEVIANGRNAMPAWKQQLSPEQVNQVTEYVMRLRQ